MEEDVKFWEENSTCDSCGEIMDYHEYYENSGNCKECQ